MAVVNAKYEFIYIDVGCQGRISDGGVFKNTSFYKKMENGSLNLPQHKPLPGRSQPVPYVLVADDAFPLTDNIMKPFKTDLNKGSPKRVYNYRLSRARRVVENSFGLLASVFRVFRKPIEVKVQSTIVDIVLACAYLHNFLRAQPDGSIYYSPLGSFDREDVSTAEIIPGSWRRIIEGDSGMRNLRRIPRNAATSAKMYRNEFMEYFMSDDGSIHFQNKYL